MASDPPITEAEYAALLPARAQKIADKLSAGLPDGMRFEWGPQADDHDCGWCHAAHPVP